MAARRRSHKTKDLPPNLYCRNGYYSFRDPRTGKEYGLGRDKRYAINEAVAANMTIVPVAAVSLADKINGVNVVLFDELIKAFNVELSNRELSKKTLSDYGSKLRAITARFSGWPVSGIDARAVSEFLDEKIAAGKKSMANLLRTTLSDIFKNAINKGLTEKNPVEKTRPARVTVEKERLLFEEYLQIRETANSMQPWVGLCFDLAVVTGQREGDLAKMRWSDICDDKLCVVQGKTKAMVRISLDNQIEALGISLREVLAEIKKIHGNSEFLLAGKSGKALSTAFKKAREKTGLTWENPPPFHELRSLSGRLYAKQKGKDFAQDILGHKSASMTEKYTDGRGKEWKDV